MCRWYRNPSRTRWNTCRSYILGSWARRASHHNHSSHRHLQPSSRRRKSPGSTRTSQPGHGSARCLEINVCAGACVCVRVRQAQSHLYVFVPSEGILVPRPESILAPTGLQVRVPTGMKSVILHKMTCHFVQDDPCSIPIGTCASKPAGQIRLGHHVCVCVCVYVYVRVFASVSNSFASIRVFVFMCAKCIDIHIRACISTFVQVYMNIPVYIDHFRF